MNCHDARTDIALYAGGDLDDSARLQELRRHVAACPACRKHSHAVRKTLKTLHGLGSIDAGATWVSTGSLWPRIQQEIARPPQPIAAQVVQQLRHWSPFAAMTAACALLLAVINWSHPASEPSIAPRGLELTPLVSPPDSESSRSESESRRSQSESESQHDESGSPRREPERL